MGYRWLAIVAAVVPGVALAIVPEDGGPLVLSPASIHVGPGDQFHAHVDGDLVSYTDGEAIRYFNFSTFSNDLVPQPPETIDQFNDASGVHVVFARLDPSFHSLILVHDTTAGLTTEVDPQPALYRTNPSIGGATIAFEDRTVGGFQGEIFVAELGGAGATRLTVNTHSDRFPAVSPLGDVIVWSSCVTTPANCDIHQALQSGASWIVSPVTNTTEPESGAHTDGVFVTYDANRSGERDIYWRLVAGGPEQRLELPGFQRYPSVSSGVVTFEGEVPGDGATELFVYHIATNKLYRITSTPGLEESLNDVSVLPDGRVRIVWDNGLSPNRNVFGATFELPCDAFTWYRDADGDGYGDPNDTIQSCTQPAGYTDGASDCDDSNASTHPYAAEVKDGADNQCPGDECTGVCGQGVIDEITEPLLWDGTTLYWPPQEGAESYEVVRSPVPTFTSACFFDSGSLTFMSDPSIPASIYYYLVRSVSPPPPGSWGQRSDGSERAGGCLGP